ncbi:MAG: heavy-metal-associated domain-containing protein [Lachnospiraceae bacterium]|nr:heavy-metal-associated domain-containing protein [Lachnospiraceae bacterium]
MTYIVYGMMCVNCKKAVENAASKVNGVESAVVNLMTNELMVQGKHKEKDIIKAIKSIGYNIEVKDEYYSEIDFAQYAFITYYEKYR